MYNQYIKRIIDLIFSIIALPFVLVLTLPVGVAIKLEDGGTIFYSADRYGINMKKFKMLKFRTMKMNAPDIRNVDGTTFNSDSDSRLTKVGKLLRKASIDELPQIYNVLFGDMSFVGPRPSPMGNEATYTGITGYNQAIKRNSATLEERYKNDVYYAENVSLIFDIKIIILTIKTVLLRKNVYHN